MAEVIWWNASYVSYWFYRQQELHTAPDLAVVRLLYQPEVVWYVRHVITGLLNDAPHDGVGE